METSADSSMGKIAQASMITGSAMLIAAAISLAKGKTIALLQGSAGIGLLGQFSSLQALITGIAALGLSLGIIKYISQFLASNDYEKASSYWRTALFAVTVTSATSSLVLIILSGVISTILTGDDAASIYVIIIALAIPFSTYSTIFNGFVNGARAIKSLAIVTVFTSLGGFLATVPLVYYFNNDGIIAQITVTAMISLALNFYASRKITRNWPTASNTPRFHKTEFKSLFRFGLIGLITTGTLFPVTMLIAQTIIIRSQGLSANGLFQGAWQIFWIYIGFATTSVGVYLLPTMSATDKKMNLRTQINNSVRFLALVTTPIAYLILLFPGQIISLLYSPEFTTAAPLLSLMMIAGAFRIISFPIAMVFLAKSQLLSFFLIECSWYVTFLLAIILLLPVIGLIATGVGILIGYAVLSSLYVILAKRTFDIVYTPNNWRGLAFSSVLLVAAFGMVYYLGIWSLPIAAILLPVWFFLSTKKNERVWIRRKIDSYLRRLLKST